ncbi:hypothetical protein JFN87_15945 [Streptomyces bomunensis]|uniref:Uncharacterized protein n=1 Tax=Streptomyces montanisoli TaxID=2798581 RepID=A0A940MDP2_9ACTN|nr:hypothetical protein [Streptomyces montanisoli]
MIGAGLTPTLAFLYQRLERLLDRGDTPEADPQPPTALAGTLVLPLQADASRLAERTQDLEELRDALHVYYRGDAPVAPSDDSLLRTLGRLRGVLEEIYGQHLTFQGEQRPASGTVVRQRTRRVTGRQIGMDAGEILGDALVDQDVDTVERSGTNIGMRARRIGPPPV